LFGGYGSERAEEALASPKNGIGAAKQIPKIGEIHSEICEAKMNRGDRKRTRLS
jgi:hypothetical protein